MKEYICIRLILSLSAVQLCSEMNVAVLVWLVITICATLYESLYKVGHTVSVKVGHVPLCLKYYSSVIFPILLCCGYWCTDLAAVMARTIKKVQANKSENQKRQKNPQQMKGPKRQAVNTWQEDRMFGAIEEFKRVGGQLRFIARA